MSALKYIAFVIAVGPIFRPPRAISQPSVRPSMMATLNREAGSSGPAGIHEYSQALIQYLLINNTHSALAASLTDRLERAELLSRQGKWKPISESDIAQAFNVFLRKIGAPSTLAVDTNAVHNARVAFEDALPSVISRKTNGSSCKPGEAIWVVSMLIANVGRTVPPSQQAGQPHVAVGPPPVQRRLELFYASHSQSQAAKAFDRLFNRLHI